jgi:FtsZ-binding cell division protein ZapB
MPNQSAAADVHSMVRILPTPQPSDEFDPLPAMRREISLLRIELQQLREMENEARKTNEFLVAHFDRIMDSRDRWQREAERLRALYEQTLNKPYWSLSWWRTTIGLFHGRATLAPADGTAR